MTRTYRLRPRPDQVGELTRGQRLPLPNLSNVHLDVIADALVRAWEGLIQDHGSNLRLKDENELNALLQGRLNNLRFESRLLSQIVSCVVRGAESVSYDGRHIEKRPDLSLYLTGRQPNFPLVVECKIIDAATGKGVDLYCVNGVRRFVEGEYAWAASQGVMLAYVRDRSSIDDCLTPHLQALSATSPDTLRTIAMPSRDAGVRSPAAISQHDRDFRYVSSIGNDVPGPITVWHLWIKLPSQAHG